MTIPYNLDIPDAPNNPSNDQPKMKVNTNANDAWNKIDHYTYASPVAGNHQWVHLPSYTVASVINGTATEGSVIFSSAGRDDPAHAQLYFLTPNITSVLSTVKAFGYFDNNGNPIGNQYNNVGTVTPGATGVYAVVLTPGAVTSTNFVVLVSSQQTAGGFFTIGNYVITGIGTFNLLFAGLSVGTGLGTITGITAQPQRFSFVVIQF